MAVAAAGAGCWALAVGWLVWEQTASLGRVGADLDLYLGATREWLAGGSFYPAHQLAGPYVITDGDVLYPPSVTPLFLPFLILPAALFMLLPLGSVAWVVVRQRPAPWTWPVMAACLAFTPTMVKLVHFNPFAWSAAVVALGTVYGWPGVFVMLKPSLAPFALVGIRRRWWWVAAAGYGVVALLFAPMWPDYLSVLANSSNEAGLLYSLSDMPLLLVPLVVWLGRTRPSPMGGVAADGLAPSAP
jgi:hypothetical protein